MSDGPSDPEGPGTGPEPVSLADFLRDGQEQILLEWEHLVRSRLATATDVPRPALRDHLPPLLENMVDLVRSADEPSRSPNLERLPELHALERLELGFDLETVISELAALREVVLRRFAPRAATRDGRRVVEELGRFDGAVAQITRKSLTTYQKARERTLVALDRISAAALGDAQVDAFLSRLLDVLRETTEAAEYVAISLVDGDRMTLRAAAGPEAEQTVGFEQRVGEGFVGHIARERAPRLLHDAATDASVLNPYIRSRGFRALYGAPLVHEGSVVGVAVMGSTTATDFSSDDKQLFRAMVGRATALLVQAQLQDEVRASEERFRLLVEEVQDYAIFMMDAEGRVCSWNLGAQRIKGYTEEEILGQPYEVFFPEALRKSGEPRRLLEEARAKGRAHQEGERVRKGGQRFFADATLTAITHPQSGRFLGFAKITRDITEQRRREAERAEAEQLRDQFLGVLGHDLRNPLQAIGLTTGALLQNEAFPGVFHRHAARIAGAAHTMQRMIDDLLDLTRGRMGGGIPVAPAKMNLRALVDQVEGELGLEFVTRDIEVEASEGGDFEGEWDSARLHQLVHNLARNALRYGDPGAPVRITLRDDASKVRLLVHNTGEAIPPELQRDIFKPFRRGRTDDLEGLGLGLYIVHEIVKSHGGSIEVRSSREHGTTFDVTLPRVSTSTKARREPAPP